MEFGYPAFIDASFSKTVYRDRPVDGHQSEWEFIAKAPCESLPREVAVNESYWVLWSRSEAQIDGEPILHHAKPIPEPKAEECENFVRALRFYFENENEIRINEPRKKPKTFNHQSLGFDRATTDEWQWFIRLIEGPDHFYRYGPSKKGHQKIKAYDANRVRLREINKKLVGFFKREYGLDMSDGYKVYEKAAEEGPGVFRFKFKAGTNIEKSKYDRYTKDELLKKLKTLSEQVKLCSNHDDPAKQAELSKLTDFLIEIATLANDKGWIMPYEPNQCSQQILGTVVPPSIPLSPQCNYWGPGFSSVVRIVVF
jgi:hypothetical protein